MTSRRRGSRAFVALILIVLAGIIIPFVIWGDQFDQALSPDGAKSWLQAYGSWAWAAGIALLMADILLPIPGTVVMSALGWMYGWWLGGLIASAGSFLSGVVAYGLCRWLGRPAARWIAGDAGLARGEAFFARSGGWVVALSRWTPVLPEAVACLAGMSRMPLRPFMLALACGCLPLGFAFAAIGHLGQFNAAWAVGLSAGIPVLLFAFVWRKWVAPPAKAVADQKAD